MPQHDLDIANQSAPNFRADLNNALEALVTLSSGATPPSNTYANMLWYETDTNVLRMRTEADDGWISLFNLDQNNNTSYPTSVPQVIDEDSFATNSATRPPTQQSTKAYVDGEISDRGIGGFFESAEISLSSATASVTHGLGGVPKLVTFSLRCVVAELGYSVGDEVSFFYFEKDFNSRRSFTVWANSTEVGFSKENDPVFSQKTGSNETAITPSSWRFVARAWR